MISDFSSFWFVLSVLVLKVGFVSVWMNGIRNLFFVWIDVILWYVLKILFLLRLSDLMMYWYVCVWIVFLNVWCSRNCWYLGVVMWWYVLSMMLFVVSELVVMKKLRLCFMMWCLFLVRLFGFFYSVMLWDMLIFCGI